MIEKWQVKVLKDGKDLFLPLPDEALELLGVAEVDSLLFEKRDDGTYVLAKADSSGKMANSNSKGTE